MCGIDGFLDLRRSARVEDMTDIVARMTTTLVHRGPDASGSWVDADAGIALGHRRLSIIDLTDAGAQPMHSASGRYVISYNGEIYNAVDLAHELTASGQHLRGHCDTEVLLEAIDAWGLDRALERSNGMFAFALWDRRERRLHLVRDRLGEKPLYYGWMGDTLLFASELKSLRAHPAFRGSVDRDALAAYFRCELRPRPALDLRRCTEAAAGLGPHNRGRSRPRPRSRCGPGSVLVRLRRVHRRLTQRSGIG